MMHSKDIKPVVTEGEMKEIDYRFKLLFDRLDELKDIDKEVVSIKNYLLMAMGRVGVGTFTLEIDSLHNLKLNTDDKTIEQVASDAIVLLQKLSNKDENISLCNTFFTPKEMLRKGVFGINHEFMDSDPDYKRNFYHVQSFKDTMIDNQTLVKDWFDNHCTRMSGVNTDEDGRFDILLDKTLKSVTEEFQQLLKTEDSEIILNSYRQYILELGWNPNILYIGQKLNRLNDKSHISMVDLTEDDEYIEEAVKSRRFDGEYQPVFIILTEGESIKSKVIKKFTGSDVSHASLSFDLDLDRVYSFNKRGFELESRRTLMGKGYDYRIEVYSVIMHKNQIRRIEERLENMLHQRRTSGYNYLGILGFAVGRPIKRNNRMFCSEFVDSMLKLASFDITDKTSGLVSPVDFAKSKNKNIYKLYEGKASGLPRVNLEKKMDKAIRMYTRGLNESVEIFHEAKEFPVSFDKEGNLLIKNMKKLDFEKEYYKSHKLIEIYRRTDNLEGLKYELSALWFMVTVLEDKIYNSNIKQDEKQKLTVVRAKILNDFKSNLAYVSKKEKDFNFIEYYDNTPFSDAVYKISKSTIRGTINLLKSLL